MDLEEDQQKTDSPKVKNKLIETSLQPKFVDY